MQSSATTSDHRSPYAQRLFIRWLELALNECCKHSGICKLENDKDVQEALQSSDPLLATRQVKKWHSKTMNQIKALRVFTLIEPIPTSTGYEVKCEDYLPNFLLWSCVSQSCETSIRQLTKKVSKAIKPFDGMILLVISVNISLITATKFVLKWSKVEKRLKYVNWNYYSLLEDILTLITPLLDKVNKRECDDARALIRDFERCVVKIIANAKSQPPLEMTPWHINKTSTNEEFVMEARRALSSSNVLSDGINTFIEQIPSLQEKTNNDMEKGTPVATKSIVERKERKAVSFPPSPSAKFDAVLALSNVKPYLQLMYQNIGNICHGFCDILSDLEGGVRACIHRVYDRCKSNTDSLGRKYPEELLAIGNILHHLLQIEVSGTTTLSRIEDVLIYWLESKLPRQLNDSDSVIAVQQLQDWGTNNDVLSFILNELKDQLGFLSAVMVVDGDLTRLDYTEKNQATTREKSVQEKNQATTLLSRYTSSKGSSPIQKKRAPQRASERLTPTGKRKKTNNNPYMSGEMSGSPQRRSGRLNRRAQQV